ncbi:MAG: hypothetical protein ABL308_03005 [Oceanicaulis sp.]
MEIWQHAAGDGDRSFADLCIRNNVILLGPSNIGRWGPNAREKYLEHGIKPRTCTILDRFCTQMSSGDLVVLREGTSTVRAVGRIVGDYEYIDAFLDVDGWDVAHARRVHWVAQEQMPRHFPTYTMKLGDTTQILPTGEKAHELRAWIKNLFETYDEDKQPEFTQFDDSKSLDIADCAALLFECGLSATSATSLTDRITDLTKLAQWYRTKTEAISEAETLGQLVLPLFVALGWSPQTLAMEWSISGIGRIDLAAFRPFRQSVRNQDDIVLVLEAKRFNRSCLVGVEQARSYASALPNAERLVVTDGLRYAVFIRDETGTFPESPHAYLNLAQPKDHYAALDCLGADEALLALSAAWRPGLLTR